MNISAFPKEVIQQVVKIIQDIVARLSGYPWFLFGIIPMLFAVVALIFLTFTTAPPFLVQLVPFALLVFGLLVIGAHAFVPRRGKDIQEIMDENLSQEQVKERISRIADFDWTVVEPRVKHWAEHQGAINPYDLGPKNWERCLYDLGLPGGRKHTLEYDKSGRLKYQ